MARSPSARGPVRRPRRLAFEPLEARTLLTLPFGALPDDTAEVMIGRVLVTPVFFESDGTVDPNTETWTASQITQAKNKVQSALQWWEDTFAFQGSNHSLQFEVDWTHADTPVRTRYEPIARPSGDYVLWLQDFLTFVGQPVSGDVLEDVRDFNHAQRERHDTDWAFTLLVVNDARDLDGEFAPGGTLPGLSLAFSFAGGLFSIVPAARPTSTYAHEFAHAFWSRDEYAGGSSWTLRRGYYDTQNVNAADNPTPGFQQQLSLMSVRVEEAFENHTSSRSSLEMMGWRDSDLDGIFDLLDVDHSLSGTGWYDPATGQYRFVGRSAVQTLPNRNSSGSQSDITLNKISRVVYRIDGGGWQTAEIYDTHTADLNLAFAVPAGQHTIEIRTLDDDSGVSSPTFVGTTQRATSLFGQGVSGFVWNDANRDGTFGPGESGLADWTVRLVDANGQPVSLRTTVDPDSFAANAVLSLAVPQMTFTALGAEVTDSSVVAGSGGGSTGSRAFQFFRVGLGQNGDWSSERRMKVAFASPVSFVSLDAIGASANSYGRLEAYDANNNLLARFTTGKLTGGQVAPMSIRRTTADIAYVIAKGHAGSPVRLDNLAVGPAASVVTDALGAYSLPALPANTYHVQAVAPAGWSLATTTQQVVLAAAGTATQTNFSATLSSGGGGSWRNTANPTDVNASGSVTPLDALLVINDLNTNGARVLPNNGAGPPFLDVDGNGSVSPIDALLVINRLNNPSGATPASTALSALPAPGASDQPSSPAPQPEGEAPTEETILFVAASRKDGQPIANPGTPHVRRTEPVVRAAFVAPPSVVGRPAQSTLRDDALAADSWAAPATALDPALEHLVSLLAHDVCGRESRI